MTDPSSPHYWDQVYRDEPRPGWDLGKASPLLGEILDLAPPLVPGARVAVPGCGFGHDAAALAGQGFEAWGIDFAPLALKGARERYGEAATWSAEDWLTGDLPAFDAVFDHTCFVAMAPDRREAYLEATAGRLVPGGLWLAAFFHDTGGREGPPFDIDPADLRTLASARFDLLAEQPALRSHPRRLGREFLVVARKR
ncbi:MAG: methyltransferase domain-containing protein [Holophagaceae bacterium]